MQPVRASDWMTDDEWIAAVMMKVPSAPHTEAERKRDVAVVRCDTLTETLW